MRRMALGMVRSGVQPDRIWSEAAFVAWGKTCGKESPCLGGIGDSGFFKDTRPRIDKAKGVTTIPEIEPQGECW